MLSLFERDVETLTIPTLKSVFKSLELNHSYPRKEHYLKKLEDFKKVINFTWRDDQREVIENFLKFDKDIYIIHAVFGSGKTTLLLGLLIHGILNNLFKPSEVMFVSFNISIKNEIKKKLTRYGMGSKTTVRTFDSIIYEICKNTGYPHIDLPNFDGKRRHVYNKIFDEECSFEMSYQPSIIFIDECQDLEKTTMDVFRRFYPNSKFVLAGDIFQSIQKEPRESVLWNYLHRDDENIYKIYMSETPRVPAKNLETLKKALSAYYPEFSDKINNWKSSNNQSDADIEWRSLETYTQVFDELKDFCKDHTSEETMILTFSSAITVKGAMGDIARFRRFLEQNDIHVNKNHKRMEDKDYFLTTANSSKGLERDYVIVFLTFPLEKAFINLSDDIVVNLITVALTRAKKKVIMYVPKYQDKFSRVLNLFDACPKPVNKRIREDDKSLTEYEYADYLNLEHTVTELIRQSIIRYDTRISLKEKIKPFSFEKLFDENIPVNIIMNTEEERAFVGVFIENLITSTWSGVWPFISNHHADNNPMYNHCCRKIKSLSKEYESHKNKNIQDIKAQFEGIFCFSQLQMALTNKIMFNMTNDNKKKLLSYWYNLKPKAFTIKPSGGDGKIKIQSNMKMRQLKGVADTIITDVKENKEEITVIEIKASQEREWKDDALIQAMCYALMSGKKWSRIILLNPFRNEKVSYYFNTKNILSMRKEIFQDIMTFNINCLLAKNTDNLSNKKQLRVENCMFIDFEEDEDGEISQLSLIRMVSPIKCEVLYNKYITREKEEGVKSGRKMKLQYESETTLEDAVSDIDAVLKNPLYHNENKLKIYCREDFPEGVIADDYKYCLRVNETTDEKMKEIEKYDSLCKCSIFLSLVFQKYKFY